jgi:DNA-directed RNA polymerase specialized sigma24 family protein
MTDIKLSNLDRGNYQVVAKATHKELAPYIKSLARKHAKRLGCEPSDIEGDLALLILEKLDDAINRADTSVTAYLRTAIHNKLVSRMRKHQIQFESLEIELAFNASQSYSIERQTEVANTIAYKLTDLEYKVCLSRVQGESWSAFLKANPDVSKQAYYDAIKSVRDKLGGG